jgi:hypothetical protein
MPSHLKDGEERPSGVSVLDVKGNDHADKLARVAADKHQVPLQVSTDYLFYVSLVAKIQRRLAAIIVSLPDRKREDREATASSSASAGQHASLRQCLDVTDHDIVHKGERVSCRLCGNSFSSRDPMVKHWMKCKCTATPAAPAVNPNPVPVVCMMPDPSRTMQCPQRNPGITHLEIRLYTIHTTCIYLGAYPIAIVVDT